MAEAPRRPPALHAGRVLSTARVSPHLIRVVLGGPGLDGFSAGEYTDHYVKLQFPQPGVDYPEPFELATIRDALPREQWPQSRTYTVRSWDPDARELAIDFVHHGDEGLAGPWAANAVAGDLLYFSGPGGAYSPDPQAGWHLFAGDESALPAIAVALEALPADAVALAFLEVADAAEELKLDRPHQAEIRWLHRGARPIGEPLAEAVIAAEFPPGQVHAFVHGEAQVVKELRRHLRQDRGIGREQLSISGYWRRGFDENGWQSSKREWNSQVEQEQERS
jgi:NADPH-dependent ferric siderophore reductase